MDLLKITAEGLTTSFRYPHFMIGVQPTFQMPPPATLYGHVCSALGKWVEPQGVHFAVHFTYAAVFEDVEHTHLVSPSTGKLKGSRIPKVLEGDVNPFRRQLLFQPRLVLYLNRPEWAEAFRNPRYALVLGRSQDLCTYTRVEVIQAELRRDAYFEHTYAPQALTKRAIRGVSVLMPRWLDYRDHRFPTFDSYVILHRKVHTQELLLLGGEEPPEYWVDPTTQEVNGTHLGLFFHTWVD